MIRKGIFHIILCTILSCAILLPPLLGQTDVARIAGTVVDASGAVVPGAAVTLKNERTGQLRQVKADERGVYIVNQLRPAAYSATVTAPGMATAEYTNIVLQLGQERTLDVTLNPAAVSTEVTVSGGHLANIDTSSARVGANIGEREVANMPLNGRQISQLYLLAPGATTAGGGTFDNIRFSGRSNQQNILRVDGIGDGSIIDNSPGNMNGESSSNFRLQSSLENVQEFRVESSNYPAEYGTATGGQISVATKSGSNGFHGALFEYVRNDAFDARNFFDGSTRSPLRLNQYGGSVGGPIIKDKLFFFASFEALNQRAGLNLIETVPSVAARAKAAADALTNPKIAAILPLINAYPVGALPSANAQLDIAYLNTSGRVDEYFGSARLDYSLNEKNNFTFRVLRDQGESFDPASVTGRGTNYTAVPQNWMASWTWLISSRTINEFKVGLNSAKTRSLGVVKPVAGVDLTAITVNFTGSVSIPGIASQGASAGAAVLGGLIRANSAYNTRGQPYTNYEIPFIDTLSLVRGAHNIKLGTEIRPIRLKRDSFAGTTYTFNSINDLLNNNPASIQFNADLGAPSPWSGGKSGPRHLQTAYYIGYAQDEWKISKALTMNFGLRYEYYSVMKERDNRGVIFNIVTGQLDPADKAWYQSSKLNFAPRLGLSWAPEPFKNKTVFRLGGGFFFGPGQPEDEIQPAESDRISRTLSGTGLAFPLDTAATVAGYDINSSSLSFQPRAYAPGYQLPEKVYSYTASVQQQLPGDAVLTVAYVGNLGRNLFLRSIANKITGVATNPTTGAAIVTREFGNRFAEIDYKTSGGRDHYNSLQTVLNRRFSQGLTFGLQHTWGRSIGNSQGSNEALTAANNYSFAADYGNNLYDIRHSMNGSVLWELPFGAGKAVKLKGAVDRFLGGWELGGIMNYRTGLPISLLITRADVVYRDKRNGNILTSPVVVNGQVMTEAVVNVPGGGASRNVRRADVVAGVNPFVTGADKRVYLNPAAFSIPQPGTFGNMGRNALAGPDLSQVDLTVHKRIALTEKVNLQFRGEIYNLLNRANFTNPPATLSAGLPASYTDAANATGLGGVQPGQSFSASAAGGAFGRMSSTVANTVGLGAQRQIQLSLRLNF
jgi:hypothetical protein